MTIVPVIASIVEGYGEVYALPALVRRIAGDMFGQWNIQVSTPHRVPRGKMKSLEIARAVRLQSQRIAGAGGVLIVLDADDDCAVNLSAEIRGLINSESVHIAVAVREFEAWFLAGIESLRGHKSVRDDASFDDDPELVRDAKGRLESRMTEPYRETLHQPAFASLAAIAMMQRTKSFTHFVRSVKQCLEA